MSEYPHIISFYTDNWEYPKYAKQMQNACHNMGLSHYIKRLDDTGEWIANTRLKPVFIKRALEELQEDVLWIDVDGSILRKPTLLKSDNEFRQHVVAARRKPKNETRDWHVGTLYFKYTPETMDFINQWVSMTDGTSGSDELAFENMMGMMDAGIVGEFPKEYFQMLHTHEPSPLPGTIICHRASKGDSKLEWKRNNLIV